MSVTNEPAQTTGQMIPSGTDKLPIEAIDPLIVTKMIDI